MALFVVIPMFLWFGLFRCDNSFYGVCSFFLIFLFVPFSGDEKNNITKIVSYHCNKCCDSKWEKSRDDNCLLMFALSLSLRFSLVIFLHDESLHSTRYLVNSYYSLIFGYSHTHTISHTHTTTKTTQYVNFYCCFELSHSPLLGGFTLR